MNRTSIILILTLCVGVYAELLPVVYFNLQQEPTQQSLEKLIPSYQNYVLGEEGTAVPENAHNAYSKSVDFNCRPFYNCGTPDNKSPYGLGNPRFVEALLAEGYQLDAYGWIIGRDENPTQGIRHRLVGYDQKTQEFIAQDTRISYEFAKENLRFAELVGQPSQSTTWNFLLSCTQDEKTTEDNLNVEAKNFQEALEKIQRQVEAKQLDFSKTLFMATQKQDISQLKTRAERKVSVRFRMQLKKKKITSKGCGGYYWWPVGAKSWDTIRWNEEQNGFFLYLDPTMPCDYPGYDSSNYVHNQNWRCGPCSSSTMVPGVWVQYGYSNGAVNIEIIKHSTCNIGDGYLDQYGYPTATITGVINCWADK